MSGRVDFSANASVYDRRHGAVLAEADLGRLWTATGLRAGARVLDVGAGTGRVAIPLARRGCRVTTVEPAAGMLAQLRAKRGDAAIETVAAEGARLPFGAGRFDAVVIARLLYLTPDWREILHEAVRVLAGGGCVLHEWGNGEDGEEWVRIREEARRLFEQAGMRSPFHPGVRSEADVDAELAGLRIAREGDVDLGPGPAITLHEFLRRIVEGELSYVWNVPSDVRAACLPRLRFWAEREFDLNPSIPMPRSIRWTVHRKAAT